MTRVAGRLAALSLLSGCVLGVEPMGAPARSARPDPEETPGLPPAECKRSGVNCRWSPGYRHWDGGRSVWVPGHWESANEGHDLVSNSQP